MRTLVTILSVFIFIGGTSTSLKAQWAQITDPAGSTLYGNNGFVFPGSDVFVANGLGIYQSTDNGSTWTPRNNGLTPAFGAGAILLNAGTMIAGAGNGVFLSTDNGGNWTPTNMTNGVNAMVVNGTNVFAASYAYGVFLSTDNGSNWVSVQAGLGSAHPICLAISSTHVYVGTDIGVYMSTNNGSTWNPTSVPAMQINALATIGNNTFAGTQGNGVYLSTDNGGSWNQVNHSGWLSTALYAYSFGVIGNNLIVGNGAVTGNVWLTTNNGTSWTDISAGIPQFAGYYATSFGIGNTDIYAGVTNGGTNAKLLYKRSLSELGLNLGLSETKNEDKLHIYPNPATHNVTVHSEMLQADEYVFIYNSLGQMMKKMLLTDNLNIDVSEFKPGIYYISCSSNPGHSYKLMKE